MSEQQDHIEEEQLEPLDSLIQPDSAPKPEPEPEQQENPLQGESEASDSHERDYEAEARKMGWRPKEEFNGDPSQWRDAKTFVEFGETNPAILRQRVEKLDRALEEQRAEARKRDAEYRKHMEGVRRTQEYALQRQREQYEAQIEAFKRQAAAEGDQEAYDRAHQQQQEARKAWAEEDKQLKENYPEPTQPEQQGAQPEPEVQDWLTRNPWFQTDNAMHQTAIGIEQDLLARAPGLSTAERLEKVSERIRQVFPDRFDEQPTQQQPKPNGQDRPRRQGSPVEGAQRMSGTTNDTSARFASLPSDTKQEYANMVKQGVIKDSASERRKWVDLYEDGRKSKEFEIG